MDSCVINLNGKFRGKGTGWRKYHDLSIERLSFRKCFEIHEGMIKTHSKTHETADNFQEVLCFFTGCKTVSEYS